jgi:hypothetical protein
MREFFWFAKASWKEMRGNPILFFIGFLPAWLGYRKARKANEPPNWS